MKQGSVSPSTREDHASNLSGQGTAAAPHVSNMTNRLAYGYSGTGSQRERPLREYVNILIQYRWLILASSIVGIFIGAQRLKSQPIIYETSAMVNVGSYVAPTDGPTAETIRSEMGKAEYLNNLLPLLSSYAIAQKVLSANPEIVKLIDPTFAEKAASNILQSAQSSHSLTNSTEQPTIEFPVSLQDNYLAHISTFQPNNTTLVSITATDGDAKMASTMANAHAAAFMELVRQQRFVWATVNVDYLKGRLTEISERSRIADKKLIDFAKKHSIDIGGTNRVGDGRPQRFDSVLASLGDAILERASTEQELRAKRNLLLSRGGGVDDRTWDLMPQLSKLQAEYERGRTLSYNSQYMRDLERQISDLRNLIRLGAETSVKEMQSKNRGAIEKERLLTKELEAIKNSESARAEYMVEYNLLDREAKAAKEELQKIQARLEEATVNAESDQKTVTLIDAAVIPTAPVVRGKVSLILSGLLFGLFIGGGGAFFIDYYRAAIRTVSDLTALVEAPVLGVVPSFSQSTASALAGSDIISRFVRSNRIRGAEELEGIGSVEPFTKALDMIFLESVELPSIDIDQEKLRGGRLLMLAKPHSRESESFRNIRATLRYSSKSGPPRLVLVTSGQKGDGKSTVVVNLATSIAQTGTKTLIIDADLRMPTVHTYFGVSRNGRGLSDYLMNPGDTSEYIMSTEVQDLSLMVAGTPVDNPAELLGSRSMIDLLARVSEEYDQVFIDTPPVGEIADALLISRAVNGVVVVVRSGITPKGVAQLAVRRLEQVRARIIGVTLNGLKDLDGYADGYTGGYYYSGK